jgi:hypothetical protein
MRTHFLMFSECENWRRAREFVIPWRATTVPASQVGFTEQISMGTAPSFESTAFLIAADRMVAEIFEKPSGCRL